MSQMRWRGDAHDGLRAKFELVGVSEGLAMHISHFQVRCEDGLRLTHACGCGCGDCHPLVAGVEGHSDSDMCTHV